MGFNNEGADVVSARVGRLYPFAIPLFANIGKNKITPNEEAIKDYENLVVKFNEICDCFVINVSSPNTPNLRELQEENFIKELFARLLPIAKTHTLPTKFLKILMASHKRNLLLGLR